MAFSITSKPNTKAADAEFPYGNIQDKIDGSQEGTPVNTLVYGDFHQFFAKIMDMAGIAFNNVADNAYDGFQYVEALVAIIASAITAAKPKRISSLFGDDNFYTGTKICHTLITPADGVTRNWKITGIFLVCATSKTGTAQADFKVGIKLSGSYIAETEYEARTNVPIQNVHDSVISYVEWTLGPGVSVDFVTEDVITNGGVQQIYGSWAIME